MSFITKKIKVLTNIIISLDFTENKLLDIL